MCYRTKASGRVEKLQGDGTTVGRSRNFDNDCEDVLMDILHGGSDFVDREKGRGGRVEFTDVDETMVFTKESGVERVRVRVIGVPQSACKLT